MALVASDDNHPDFVGQRNPDAALSVLFYSKPLQNNFESEEAKRPIFYDADMVKIFLPGDDKTVIDTFARDDHKKRFPLQWSHYQNKREGDQRLAGKTPITQWARVTPAMAEELRAIKFIAVEDIANASDMQLQSMGMIAGQSPHSFRDAARNYLRMANGEAAESKAQAENEALKKQMAELMARMDAMQSAPDPIAEPSGLAALAAANGVIETAAAVPQTRPYNRKDK